MRKDDVAALLIADCHFWLIPPLFRSVEPDWKATQKGYLRQLSRMAERRKVPVICAGDVFDRWNPPPELINFLIDHMPHIYAVPGQHDLPCHRYDDIHKSGYWTLVQAGKITDLKPGRPVEIPGKFPLRLHGFPWGFDPCPLKDPHDMMLEIAVIHRMIWTKETGFENAPADRRLSSYWAMLRGYDLAVFGDNHSPFDIKAKQDGSGRCSIHNCGGFMIRKSNESYTPSIGLLHGDGTITRRELDISNDKYLTDGATAEKIASSGMEDFINELRQMGDRPLDFRDAVNRIMDERRVPDTVRKMILEAMEQKP